MASSDEPSPGGPLQCEVARLSLLTYDLTLQGPGLYHADDGGSYHGKTRTPKA